MILLGRRAIIASLRLDDEGVVVPLLAVRVALRRHEF